MCHTHFVRDEDLVQGGDNRRPEDWHRGTHDCEVYLKAGDDEDFGVPPGKVEALLHSRTVLEGAP